MLCFSYDFFKTRLPKSALRQIMREDFGLKSLVFLTSQTIL